MASTLQGLSANVPWLEVLGVASAIYIAYKKICILDGSNIPSLHKYYGPIVRAGPNVVWVSSAASVRKSTDLIRTDYEGIISYAENVFTTRNPDYHRIQKRLIMPVFTPNALASMEPYIYDTCITSLVNTIGEYADAGKVADLTSLLRNMSFDAIGEIGFGKTFEFLDESKEKHPIIGWMFSIRTLAIMKSILGRLFSPKMFPRLKKENQDFDNFALDNDILQQLVAGVDQETGTQLSDEVILANMFILLYHTTAVTLTRVIAHLMDHPKCYKRLQEEIKATYPDPSCEHGLSDAVIHESMRVHPVAPFGMPRIVPKGGTTLDGHYVPEGTTVMVSINVMQMDKDAFPEPEVFRPERWLDSTPEQLAKMRLHFAPFSVGPRACLGRGLAWMELRMTAAELFRHFTFESAGKNSMTPTFLNGFDPKFQVHVRRNKY
ncbi:cytochrome P450 [Syncephalis plumigaleata]|nr:cytochrome P450 [Syncephalis plumigaleata]